MSSLSNSSTGIENSNLPSTESLSDQFSDVPELTYSLPIEEYVEYSDEYIRQIALFINLNAAQLFRENVYDGHIERKAGKYILPGDCVAAVDELMQYLYGKAYVSHRSEFIESIRGWYPAYSYGMRAKIISEKLGIDSSEEVRPRVVNVVYTVNWKEGRLTRRSVKEQPITINEPRFDPDAILSTCLTRSPPPPPELALKRAVVATFTAEAALVISKARKRAYLSRVRSIFDSTLLNNAHVLHRFSPSTRRAAGGGSMFKYVGSTQTIMQNAPVPRSGLPDFSAIHVHFSDQQTDSFFETSVQVRPSRTSPRRALSSRPPRSGVPTDVPYLSLSQTTNARLVWNQPSEEEDRIDWEPHRIPLGIALGRIRGLIAETPVSGLKLCQYIDWEYRERARRCVIARPVPGGSGYIFGDCHNCPVDNDSIALLVRYNFCELYDLGRVPIGRPEHGVAIQRLVTRRTRDPARPMQDGGELWEVFEELIGMEMAQFDESVHVDEAAMGLTSLRYQLELGRTWALLVRIARQNVPRGLPSSVFDPDLFLTAGACALVDAKTVECYSKDVSTVNNALNAALEEAWTLPLSWIEDPYFAINCEWDIIWARLVKNEHHCNIIRQDDESPRSVVPGETVIILYSHDDFSWLAETVARVCGISADSGPLIGQHTRVDAHDALYTGWLAGRDVPAELPNRVIICGPCPLDVRRWLEGTGCRIVTVDSSLHESALSLQSFKSKADLRVAWKAATKKSKITAQILQERNIFLYGNDVIAKTHVVQRKININGGRVFPAAVHVAGWDNIVSWFKESIISSFTASWSSSPANGVDPSYAISAAWLWKFACQCVHPGAYNHDSVNSFWTNQMQWNPVQGEFVASHIPIHVSIGLKILLPDPRIGRRPYQLGNGRARLGVVYRIRLVCPEPESASQTSSMRLHATLQRPGSPSRDIFSVFRPRSYQLPDPNRPEEWKREFTVDGQTYTEYQLTRVPCGAVTAFEQLLEKTSWPSNVCGYTVSVVRADGRAYDMRLTDNICGAESISFDIARDAFARGQLCSRMYACGVTLSPPPGPSSETVDSAPSLTTLEDAAWLPLRTTTEHVCVEARLPSTEDHAPKHSERY